MQRKFRISVHGGAYGTWYKIQRRFFFFWFTMSSYIDSYDEASKMVREMKESDA